MTLLTNHPFAEIKSGDCASLSRTLTKQDIELFALMSGDLNPVNMDPAWAAGDRFHQLVAHGMWGGALISTVLGTQLPGPGTILLHQSLDFLVPVAIGDQVAVTVVVENMDPVLQSVSLACRIVNQRNEAVVAGNAIVIAPTEKVERESVRLPLDETLKAGAG
ncbi:MaoC/PaaZ C-terminal domain-containing protein [Duganella sp. BuS-21]|uniref:MaoC/PaaZ C-terminal domain-containing protein n=1 Tax=Duganella sp. BuS-21 TaxID=2943848 RepID=UPI0035A57A1F